MFKQKISFHIYYMEKQDDKIIQNDEITEIVPLKRFMNDLTEQFEHHYNDVVEIVNERPEKFVFGKVYIRRDNKAAWTWQLNG